MYEEIKIMHNVAILFMINDRKNPVAQYLGHPVDTL